jgi:TRAP-type transport system periplasmic protein
MPVRIRMGGYRPATTGFSRALRRIGDALHAGLGDEIDIKYVWNIMDLGYRAEDILWLVEHGLLTLGYQSSSYLTDRVPELGIVDLPFLFANTQAARAAMDGAPGEMLARRIEERVDYRVLGWFENGFGTFPTGCGRCMGSTTSPACASGCCRARCRRAPSSCWARSPCPWT